MIRIIFIAAVIYLVYLVIKALLGSGKRRSDRSFDDARSQDSTRYSAESQFDADATNHSSHQKPQGEPNGRTLPTWMNTDQIHDFDAAVFKILRRDGINTKDAKRLMNHRKTYMTALYVAGNMEQKGASYVQQQLAAGDALIALWRRTNHSQLFADDDF